MTGRGQGQIGIKDEEALARIPLRQLGAVRAPRRRRFGRLFNPT